MPHCFRLAVCAVVWILGLACARGADWPQFLGPARDGVSQETGLARTLPPEGPRVLWTVRLGPGYGGAAIEKGEVYFLDRVEDRREVLRCLDLESGKEAWSVAYEAPGTLPHNGSRSTPTLDSRYIFTVGALGHFTCFDRKDRKVVWRKDLLKEFNGQLPRWGVSQSPLLYKDWVVVAPQGKLAGVAAFEKATGRLVWKTPELSDMEYTSPLLAVFDGVGQIVMTSGLGSGGAPRGGRGGAGGAAAEGRGTQVNGINPADGSILWTYKGWQCRHPIPQPTLVPGDRLFLAGGYGAGCAMIRVQKRDGQFAVTELFKNRACGPTTAAVLFYRDHLYTNSNDNNAGLVCMDLDGNVKWQTNRNPSFDLGNLLIADGLIFAIDGANGMLRLAEASPAGYRELGSARVLGGREVWAPLALSEGKLVIRDQGQARCLWVGAGK